MLKANINQYAIMFILAKDSPVTSVENIDKSIRSSTPPPFIPASFFLPADHPEKLRKHVHAAVQVDIAHVLADLFDVL